MANFPIFLLLTNIIFNSNLARWNQVHDDDIYDDKCIYLYRYKTTLHNIFDFMKFTPAPFYFIICSFSHQAVDP